MLTSVKTEKLTLGGFLVKTLHATLILQIPCPFQTKFQNRHICPGEAQAHGGPVPVTSRPSHCFPPAEWYWREVACVTGYMLTLITLIYLTSCSLIYIVQPNRVLCIFLHLVTFQNFLCSSLLSVTGLFSVQLGKVYHCEHVTHWQYKTEFKTIPKTYSL